MIDDNPVRVFEHAGWEVAAEGYEVSFATATRQFIPALLDAACVATDAAVGGPARTLGLPDPADLEVSVLDLPGRDTRKSVYVLALVDSEGALRHCEWADREDRDLAEVACQQARSQPLPLMRDRTGATVAYVKSLKVDFIVQPSAPAR